MGFILTHFSVSKRNPWTSLSLLSSSSVTLLAAKYEMYKKKESSEYTGFPEVIKMTFDFPSKTLTYTFQNEGGENLAFSLK